MQLLHRPRRPLLSGLILTGLISSLSASAQTGSWQSLSDMNTARYAPTTTVLSDGSVLVAGGYNGSVTVTSAQRYFPGSTGFVSTGSLNISRNFATATLLNNGTVLIAGGYREERKGVGSLSSAEIYDPAVGKFTKLRSTMTSTRELFTATKLPDGKVLLVGGFKTGFGGGTLRSAEIYNPATGKFTATGSMQTPYGRFGHDAILLPTPTDANGNPTKVLIVGGKERRSSSDWRALNTAELYDIPSGAFTSTTAPMTHTRDRCTVAWIGAAGKALVVGGKAEGGGITPSDVLETEWYDPATQTFSTGPSLAQGRMAHTLTKFTLNGVENLLVTGGWSVTASSTTASAERLIVDPANPLGSAFASAGNLAHSGLDHGAAFVGGKVLVVGGEKVYSNGAVEWLKRAELYTP